ncbi:MAG: DUF932 domain-containing protein [Clostridia bacterium]
MKQGRTLQEVATELARQRESKRDFIVDTGAIEVTEDAGRLLLHHADDGLLDEQFGMTDLFHRQLGSSLGIPSKYYDKMQVELPSLLSQNVNGWLRTRDSRQTIRTLDGSARAFLSDRYRRIDNYEIATATLPILAEMDGVMIESAEITENRMYLKAVNKRLEAEVVPGDVVQAGVLISNSEVGLGSVSVMPLVYRLVCLNGMVICDYGQKKYHIGRRPSPPFGGAGYAAVDGFAVSSPLAASLPLGEQETTWELFSDDTLAADDQAFMLKLRDIVRGATEAARFETIVDKLRQATGIPILGHIPKVVELTAEQYGLNKTEANGILQHLITGGDLSLYGLSNAVTRASQDSDSYDRATLMESAGWRIATMPADQWHTINEGVTL